LFAYTDEPTFDIVDMVQRVVQGMFEQAAYVTSVSADGQTTSPAILSGILGELSEARRLLIQNVEDATGIGVAVLRDCRVVQIIADRRVRRLVEPERLLESEHVQRSDVSTMRRIFDRRPHRGFGSLM